MLVVMQTAGRGEEGQGCTFNLFLVKAGGGGRVAVGGGNPGILKDTWDIGIARP
jgi:hypothetical protein